MITNNIDYIIKAIMIGDTGVGKTTLLKKLTDTKLYYNNSTIGVDFFTLNKKIDNNNIKINFWDTAGHDRYHNLIKTYFKGNTICYIVYNISDRKTFVSASLWLKIFLKNTSNLNAIIVILANKIDNKKRVVSKIEGEEFAQFNNAIYIEILVKNQFNLDEIIYKPVKNVLENYKNKVLEASELTGFKNIKLERKTNINLNKKINNKCCVIS